MVNDASSDDGARRLTPMMEQYLELRRQLPPNTLLLFRLGDFYEMFDSDAREGSAILGITLTQRNGQPMAGIPYHAADGYVQKLLNAGKKVAICDQMEPPRPGKIVRRQLTRILTPGTALEEHQLESRHGSYLLAIDFVRAPRTSEATIAAAWLDLTTGDFVVAHEAHPADLMPVMTALDPREILVPASAFERWKQEPDIQLHLRQFDTVLRGRAMSTVADYQFDPRDGARMVAGALGVLGLDGFGIARGHAGLGPAGCILSYVEENLCARPGNVRVLRDYRSGHTLLMDPATLRNLEIFKAAGGGRDGSLLAVLDGSVTAPGSRLVESYLTTPVLDVREIKRRQSCVAEFLEAPGLASELHEYLRCVRDIPRVLGRLQNRLRNPRELGAIRDTLQQLPLIVGQLRQFDGWHLTACGGRVREFPELCELLMRGLADELPNNLDEGGYIRDGFDEQLDKLRSLSRDSKQWIAELERTEQERTGIRKLRIKFNNAFGYYIEVTRSNTHMVPDDYVRKQTTVNAERYTTPALKEKEREVLHAEERALARENELFADLVAAVLEQGPELEDVAAALAELDVFLGWARIAREWDYCQPTLDEEGELRIVAGRHPVVEQTLRNAPSALGSSKGFVPNDTRLSCDGEQIAIITGPNMAGKSTYIRQVALIVLMAQVGSFVPAKSCHVGLVDRVFSRVGASDELARGNSTFMVEMNETANILNNATERSLIILDEIGRGTSTYDGLSIAWAVVEHLHGGNPVADGAVQQQGARFRERGPRTLFATHYHELTQIDRQLTRVRNYSVAVKEWNEQIIFVRQVNPGAADRSYGIQVARLAGLPQPVIDRARQILEKLEADDSSHNLLRQRMRKLKAAQDSGGEVPQMELF